MGEISMKHLKLRAELDKKDKKFCVVEVVEQTHRRLDFGVDFHKAGSFVHGEIMLVSYGEPMWVRHGFGWGDEYREVSFRLYVRGITKRSDEAKVRVPTNMWPKIKAAVLSYNEFYSGEKTGKKDIKVEAVVKATIKSKANNEADWGRITKESFERYLVNYTSSLDTEFIYSRPEIEPIGGLIQGSTVSYIMSDYPYPPETNNGD
jgi:hypothetical protein